MICPQLPDHLEIFFVELYAESDPVSMQQIQKLDPCEPQHLRRFTCRDSLLGIELDRRLLCNRTHEFRFRSLVDRAVRRFQLRRAS